MDSKDFVTRYGSVFEHSPWVAERGFGHLEDPSRLGASTVHVALCQAFREASREERLDVLRAHPDLAGRLAVAGGLTEDSKAEQAGAGLADLTPEEHARFTDLNERYQKRFGFPFIIAVRGLGKDDVLRAFERRIRNDEAEEFSTACDEVEKIALLRLKSMLPET
jgi:2-oxo-4-hydroxy-4-carboxy-5-ureidoimidazoline decarboxylase